MAGANQGEANPPPVSALRNGTAGGGLHRAAAALFRRASGGCPQSRGAGSRGEEGAFGQGPNRDRGGGRFRPLHGHRLRLTAAGIASTPPSPHHGGNRRKGTRSCPSCAT